MSMKTRPATDGFEHIPLIDVRALVDPASSVPERRAVAGRLGEACRESGFFYVVGHGVDEGLQARLETLSRRFFALPVEEKLSIRMARGGPGVARLFPRRGRADLGPPGPEGGPLLRRGARPPSIRSCAPARPCTAPTSSPREPEELRAAVLDYMAAITRLGHALMRGLALSLDLEEDLLRRALHGRSRWCSSASSTTRPDPAPTTDSRSGAWASTPTTAC